MTGLFGCERCHGSGKIIAQSMHGFRTEVPCPDCQEQRAPTRKGDPETSYLAAATVKVTRTQKIVLEALRTGGAMTDEELNSFVQKVWTHARLTEQSVRSRRAELVKKGLVEATGDHRLTTTGNKTRVWRYTGKE